VNATRMLLRISIGHSSLRCDSELAAIDTSIRQDLQF
jgi:hypothetical protein